VIIGVNAQELSADIKNAIPAKKFEGVKKDHVFKYLKRYLCEAILPCNDVRETINRDFLSRIKISKYHKLSL
jgi:hypothetical protein